MLGIGPAYRDLGRGDILPCHRPHGRRGGGSPSGSTRSSTSGNRLRVWSSRDSLEGSRNSSNPTNSAFTQSTMRFISEEAPTSAFRCAIHPRNWSACRSIRTSLRSNNVRSVSRVRRAAASELFCIICDDKINLVHDFHSRYLDLRTYIEAEEEEQAIRFLSSNSHRWPMAGNREIGSSANLRCWGFAIWHRGK